jgi:hypothetical protein
VDRWLMAVQSPAAKTGPRGEPKGKPATREQRSQAQRDGIKRRADRLAEAERKLAPYSAEAQAANRSLGQHRSQVARAHKLDDAIARTAPKGSAAHDTPHLAAAKEHRARADKHAVGSTGYHNAMADHYEALAKHHETHASRGTSDPRFAHMDPASYRKTASSNRKLAEAATAARHSVQRGKKGGAYYVGPGGKKIYVGRKR